MKRYLVVRDDMTFYYEYYKLSEKPDNAYDVVYNGDHIKPKIDLNTMTFYEGATEEEINKFNRSLVPDIVRSRQLRLALVGSGFDLTSIDVAINNLQEPDRSFAKIEWEYATSFERNNPMLISLGTALGLSSSDIDNLFKIAVNL